MVLWILLAILRLRVRGSHPLWQAFPKPFYCPYIYMLQSEPQNARTLVWALPLSLAATYGIDVSFSSSGYLDVSVHRVPFHTLWIGVWMTEVFSAGFPHSDICGSLDICSSPQLFAAYHVFLRLLVPRHPPCALLCLTVLRLCVALHNLCYCFCYLSITPYLLNNRRVCNVCYIGYVSLMSC